MKVNDKSSFFFGTSLKRRGQKASRQTLSREATLIDGNKEDISIASISDFHLGLRNGSREYQGNEEEACRFLDFLQQEYDLVMVLGDFYGIVENKGRVEPIRHRYFRLSERVEAMSPKIYGNHDYKLSKDYLFHPWQVSYVNNFRGKNFMATHGHQFDRHNRNAEKGLGAHLARGHSFWERRIRRNMKQIQDRYHLPKQTMTIFQLIRILTFEYNISQFVEQFGYDIILTGHIHYPTVKRFPNGSIYINNGACLDNYTYSHLKPNQDVYEVRQWDPVTEEAIVVRELEDGRFSPWIGSFVQSGIFS